VKGTCKIPLNTEFEDFGVAELSSRTKTTIRKNNLKMRLTKPSYSVDWGESCDTMVALGGSTKGGNTVFAKNSDRPHDEPQPLIQIGAADYSGGFSGTQFVDVPQAAHTYRHVGSKPYWCAGYEHGYNEHQVVIGNEALPSLLIEASDPKLVGMEVLRLGLERSKSAEEAVDIITGLIFKLCRSTHIRQYFPDRRSNVGLCG